MLEINETTNVILCLGEQEVAISRREVVEYWELGRIQVLIQREGGEEEPCYLRAEQAEWMAALDSDEDWTTGPPEILVRLDSACYWYFDDEKGERVTIRSVFHEYHPETVSLLEEALQNAYGPNVTYQQEV